MPLWLGIVCIIVFASCAQKDQPQKNTLVNVKTMNVASSYGRTIDLMKKLPNVMGLAQYGGLHYEALHGDKEGLSSVKVNDQYRIEFREIIEGDKTIAEVVSITELSNHYK